MSAEKREHPRVDIVDIVAEIQFLPEQEPVTLATTNISMGGAFVACDPTQFPTLKRGSHLQLRILTAAEFGEDIVAKAQVRRIELGKLPGRTPGFGLRYFKIDMENTMRLSKLIAKSKS